MNAESPALLCYDGSDPAKRAIEEAGALLGGGPAVVLTVWESVGSSVLLYPPPVPGELGREIRGMSEDVIDGLDRGTAEQAKAVATEGAEAAAAAGFDARPDVHHSTRPLLVVPPAA